MMRRWNEFLTKAQIEELINNFDSDSGDDDCDEDMFEDEPRTTEEPCRIDDPPSELNVPIVFNLEDLPIVFVDDIESI
jgi:hypothetical protein